MNAFSRIEPAQPPTQRGLSLGWRLALSTAVIIAVVMGGVSISQQLSSVENARNIHQELLQVSLAPLAVRLESADTLNDMRRYAEEFHQAHLSKGYPEHEVVLLDAAGQQVLSTTSPTTTEGRKEVFRAEISVDSPLLDGRRGTLVVLKDNREYKAAARQDWLLWLVHFIVTVGIVSLFLASVTYFQVTRPVNRLINSVKKMEMGYWGAADTGDGAWEIRWLAWRFRSMVQEVRNSVTRLFHAEQKAWSLGAEQAHTDLSTDSQVYYGAETVISDPTDLPAYRQLSTICEGLESASRENAEAVQLAREIWRPHALEADRLGFHDLKARMEDAALSLTEPEVFLSLDQRLNELKATWGQWAERHREAIRRQLENRGIPCIGVLHRLKHTAGVWTKMQGKGLDLDEIHDLFAFRVIVPTEVDCYAALGVVHRIFTPEVGRFKDYITQPKENGYRGLHTCVNDADGPVFEVQIRSIAMDRQAQRGDAAHWIYKQSSWDAHTTHEPRRWWHWLRSLSIARPAS